jgi:hypothetical protein
VLGGCGGFGNMAGGVGWYVYDVDRTGYSFVGGNLWIAEELGALGLVATAAGTLTADACSNGSTAGFVELVLRSGVLGHSPG